MKLRLVVDVEYEPGTISEEEARKYLEEMVGHCVGNGLITRESSGEVVQWDVRVENLEDL